MKKKLPILALIAILLLSGCGKTEKIRYQAQFLGLFDTVTTIVGYADNKEDFTSLAQEIYDELEDYHKLFDIYNDYEGLNNLKTINDNAGLQPVVVDSRILSMLQFAREQYEATGGAVNVAMGSVLRLWHDYREAGINDPLGARLPPMEELLAASSHCAIDDMVLDMEASTVYLRDPLMSLDVGAIAKGYAVEQVAHSLENRGITALLLSVGGNVRAIGGKHPEKVWEAQRPWKISIQNPDKSQENEDLMTVDVMNISVISSGSYERYYTVDGVQYHHIINPTSLMPSDYFTQVTILCPDSGQADALSTAVFNMSLSEGMAYIESLEDTEALWVLKDGTQALSSGFADYVDGT